MAVEGSKEFGMCQGGCLISESGIQTHKRNRSADNDDFPYCNDELLCWNNHKIYDILRNRYKVYMLLYYDEKYAIYKV